MKRFITIIIIILITLSMILALWFLPPYIVLATLLLSIFGLGLIYMIVNYILIRTGVKCNCVDCKYYKQEKVKYFNDTYFYRCNKTNITDMFEDEPSSYYRICKHYKSKD